MAATKTLLPKVILAVMALVLVLGTVPAMAARPNAAPGISPGPLSHRDELRATISAKAKLTRIELRIDSRKVQPWVKRHAGWQYTIKYPLRQLAVGKHTAKLTVRDQKNRGSQRQWVFQKLDALGLHADKTSVQPGEKITLTGQGFTPGTAITVGMGGQNTGVGGNYGSATADGAGQFTVDVTLANYPDGSPLHAGVITLLAHNVDGSEKAGVEVRVLPAPTIALDQYAIKAGEQVHVTGAGFTPGAALAISLGGVNTDAGGNYGSAVTDNAGAFALDVRLTQFPDGSPLFAGPVVLVAHTPDSAEKATVRLQILADPSISLNKTAIKAGEKVMVSGNGFTPGAAVSISLGGVNTGTGGNYGSGVVDGKGHFALEATLDRLPDGSALKPGTVVLLAHTPDFAEKASAQLQIRANPTLIASKTVIRVGDWVILSGEGFTPGKVATIGLADSTMGHGDRYGTAAVDANGRFSTQLVLGRYPDGTTLPPGGITLLASTADGEQAMVTLQLVADPAISLNKASIKPGDQVVVTGQGFTPGVAISISMGPVNGGAGGAYGTATADSNGRFSLPVTLARYPDGSPLTAGTIVLLAHTADFSQKASTQLQVLTAPTIALDKTTIQPGDKVILTGQGFTPGAPVSISLGGVNTGASGNYGAAVPDASGRFSLAVTLERYPNGLPLQAGPIVLMVHDPSWSQQASIQIQIVDTSPAAPSDLRLTSLTRGGTSAEPTMVGVQWRDNAANETGFRIQATYTRMNGGTDTQVWNVPANTTTAQVRFVAGGINPVSKACFTVTAFNSHGSSTPSNEVCALT